MEQGISPLRQYELMQLFVSFINDWIKCILKNLKIDKNRNYVCGKTYFLYSSKTFRCKYRIHTGSIGHSVIKPTENYLDSFEKEVKKEFAQRLTSFKDSPATQNDFID